MVAAGRLEEEDKPVAQEQHGQIGGRTDIIETTDLAKIALRMSGLREFCRIVFSNFLLLKLFGHGQNFSKMSFNELNLST
jgi:hypothetical protein